MAHNLQAVHNTVTGDILFNLCTLCGQLDAMKFLEPCPNAPTPPGYEGQISWLPEHPQLDADLTDAINKYDQVGCQLAQNREGYDEICGVLRSIRDAEPAVSVPPFVVIDAPSGTGKTQLGFTLALLGFQVLHCTLHHLSSTDQRVYRTMANVSANIEMAVDADIRRLTQLHDLYAIQVEFLWGRRDPLRLVQYFFRYFMDDVNRPLHRCAVSELRTALGGQPESSDRLPVVVVDEAGNNKDAHGEVIASDIIRVQYIYNLCRALRVPVC